MTDTGPYTFGFLSSLKSISFPSGYGLICVFSTIQQAGGSIEVVANGLEVPIRLLESDTPVQATGGVGQPYVSGRSLITTIPANPFFFIQNFLAFRLTGPVTTITMAAASPSSSASSLFYFAAYCKSLDFSSFAQQGADVSLSSQGSMTFKDAQGNAGGCFTGDPITGFQGSMILNQDIDEFAPIGSTPITWTRSGTTVTGA